MPRKHIIRNNNAIIHMDKVFSFSKHFGVSSSIWILPELLNSRAGVLVTYFVDEETEARMRMMCPMSHVSQQLKLGRKF